ncbi:MAG: hypothetical protein ACKE9I_04335 [Methylophagaceae bacterium]
MLIARFLFCTWLILPAMAIASDTIKLSIGSWSFDDLQAQNIQFDLALTSKGLGLIGSADSIVLAAPIGLVQEVKLQCHELLFKPENIICSQGEIDFHQQELGTQSLAFSIIASPNKNNYQLAITGLKLASSTIELKTQFDENSWQATINTPRLSLIPLIEFITPYLQNEQLEMLSEWDIEGDITLSSVVHSGSNGINKVDLQLSGSGLNLSDAQTQYVMEDVKHSLQVNLERKQQIWLWQSKLHLDGGQGYGEPVFIDFETTAVNIQANGLWQQGSNNFEVSNAKFEHHNVVQAQGSFKGNLDQIDQLNIELIETDIASLYEIWLQPFAVGTAADNIELAGTLSMKYKQQAKDYQLSLNLDKVFVDDNASRFGLNELSGTMAWTNHDQPVMSDIQWDSGYLYAIPLGSSRIKAQAESSSLMLTQAMSLPILDGELQVNEFSLQRPGDEHSKWTFAGLLTPISMESLSASLSWPLLHGKISGVIPRVSYANQYIQVDGELSVNLFEGTTVIRDLKLEKPFGSLPQLYANIDLKGLNLETLTRTFDFGKITGKLDGEVNNLRLSNWQPVQFNANFATPDGDKSRRRISQKAVDNLSQIGGGASGLLQRSFLRFFEDFSYQKLGLSCILRNEVCEMSGVDEAEQGYYIVKGGGLPPRINVVGYTRRVDWPDLIARLKAVNQSSGPVVQ